MKRLVFMPDYSADPLWDDEGGEMVSLDALPVSVDLRERVRSWALRWEKSANEAIFDEALDDEAVWQPIREDQHSLWLALREELGGRGYEVGLEVPPPGREERAHVIWAPGGIPELAGWFKPT